MKALVAVADGGLGIAVARGFARAGAETVAIGPRTEPFAGLGAFGVGLIRCERYGAAAMASAVDSASDDGGFDVAIDVLGGAAAGDAAALGASAAFARAAVRAMLAQGGGTLLLVATPGVAAESTALRAAFHAQFALNLRTDLHGSRVRVMELQAGAALAARRLAGGLDVPSPAADAPAWESAVADTVWWLATRPAHVVVNALELEAEPRA